MSELTKHTGDLEVVGKIFSEDGKYLDPVKSNDAEGYLYSMTVDRQELSIIIEGTSVYLELEAIGGGDIAMYFSDKKKSLNCTTNTGTGGKARIEIPQGTPSSATPSVIYAIYDLHTDSVILARAMTAPVGESVPMAVISIQDYATVASSGPLVFQRITETIHHNNKGAISYMREKLRALGAEYWSGIDPTLSITNNVGGIDNIGLTVTNGTVFQMHRQAFPNYNISTEGLFILNSKNIGVLTKYQRITDINQIVEDQYGNPILSGESIVLTIIGVMNGGGKHKLFVNLPKTKYATGQESLAQLDANNTADLRIPTQFKTVGFLLCQLVLKYDSANFGTWTNLLPGISKVWNSIAVNVSSPNYPADYPNGTDIITVLTEAGASSVRVRFDAFNTELGYDFVHILDASDNIIYSYDGNLGAFTSPEVAGDTLKVRFISDSSIQRSGFSITTLEASVATGEDIIDLR